ncbi:hypothetical protein PGTDC60_1622 [Porphyromonas gingivalis TDC60]|uniref:Uncharacterized protein n=3 Tax=Porphyromonas gingivalis TaxID=837 RepID=Q7MWT3_PORGI|nr:hypothetical protein PG_0505 [Porphyromonas gingivalis W83]ERJ67170.1 hypothetical protein HMPREF1555_00859 [Porphyromonas gingivalis F0570]ERJ67506.1 hypothetical protein HMPREF1553_01388 [Porphyromonas gingivalis F0568]ERJ70114.1 hypothetical protein HMPREF1554_00435 [Porphyromonas gingivalis F0569]ERJ83564.1 hypothetical protein HMPREF1988_01105 [Porphyromonas gingivalis F0185]ERJ86494.1 hypothetical protein HMPREF1989_01212 [Porphyromonas gingivalis F0566]ERJ87865.1 hypothetical protei
MLPAFSNAIFYASRGKSIMEQLFNEISDRNSEELKWFFYK